VQERQIKNIRVYLRSSVDQKDTSLPLPAIKGYQANSTDRISGDTTIDNSCMIKSV